MKAVLGQEFRPAPQLRSLYYTYLFIVFFALFLMTTLPVLILVPILGTIFLLVLIVFLSPVALWIHKYYHTIVYSLTGAEITWKRGVWFRKTGVVPYNRITNVDIDQGPISRSFGIAAIKIQTAGYSGPNVRSSEIKIEGMRNFEELRETIMGFVRGGKPMAVETYGRREDKGEDTDVLSELVKIRKLLEKRR